MKLLRELLIVSILLLSCEVKVQMDEQITEKISFWDKQRKGTNYFNKTPTKEWFDSADSANIKFVRFVYEKWESEQNLFLIGSADTYEGLIEKDFTKLKKYLDYASTLEMKVVICPISIPGEKWRQSNNGELDGRLWKTSDYIDQVGQFWKDLASRLKDHPAIVGYNLVNEPHPEIYYEKYSFWERDLDEWYNTVKGTPADLNLFNKKIVREIRAVDTETPIIIESGLYATPWAFDYLEPLIDDKIIYSFHMYEPYGFTTGRINDGQYSYPGRMIMEETGEEFGLNREGLSQFFNPIREWSKKHGIPTDRIWVGEFGCSRHVEGVDKYLEDLISIFNQENWHWSFYAYREDVWEAMDYELGTKRVFYKYWDYQESKELHLKYDEIYGRVEDTTLWDVFKKEFN